MSEIVTPYTALVGDRVFLVQSGKLNWSIAMKVEAASL
jgi:hypothetical protein